MLIFDLRLIVNKLLGVRKKTGMTQAEAAEAAGISDRTYADIERGTVNMRIETVLKICEVFHITPDEILTDEDTENAPDQTAVFERLKICDPRDRETALRLVNVYLRSLN